MSGLLPIRVGVTIAILYGVKIALEMLTDANASSDDGKDSSSSAIAKAINQNAFFLANWFGPCKDIKNAVKKGGDDVKVDGGKELLCLAIVLVDIFIFAAAATYLYDNLDIDM